METNAMLSRRPTVTPPPEIYTEMKARAIFEPSKSAMQLSEVALRPGCADPGKSPDSQSGKLPGSKPIVARITVNSENGEVNRRD